MPDLKILLVHGVGHAEANPQWSQIWQNTIEASLREFGFQGRIIYQAVPYDALFDRYNRGPQVYVAAVTELLASAAWHAITDPFSQLFHREMVARDLGDEVRWRVGMVAQWVVEEALRADCRRTILSAMSDFKPAIVAAHSLGSLLTYDTFTHDEEGRAAIDGLTYLTFGSQIANPFVKARAWAGRVVMLERAKFWYHLFNHRDPVLTHEIKLPGTTNFLQVIADSPAGHSPVTDNGYPGYLDNPNTKTLVWRQLAQPSGARAITRNFTILREAQATPKRRALLVGINNYPDPANRLEGCVNDVFLMSSLLQEKGFDPEDIRVVLDERATRATILDRLEWLLDGSQDEHERVFFYSGHGAQIPAYGAREEVDHLDECLVPYDFDWSPGSAITDDVFFELYSQLPYDARFLSIFDCCHSGGLTRAGSHKARGLNPPDDIRHRALKWNIREQMWEDRELPDSNPDLSDTRERRIKYTGESGAKCSLGRAIPLRALRDKTYAKICKRLGHKGPFMPVIFEACGEEQLSYEYRHGATSYGAFTFALAKNLRAARARPTYRQLIEKTNNTLKNLSYDQTAQAVGPSAVIDKPIPGKSGKTTRKR